VQFKSTATLTFDFYPLRFRYAPAPGARRRAWTANALRGAFGSAMRRLDYGAYHRYFAPERRAASALDRDAATAKNPQISNQQTSVHRISEDQPMTHAGLEARPSGLADPPRPFVFRVRELSAGIAGLNLFLTREPQLPPFIQVMNEIGFEPVGDSALVQMGLDEPAGIVDRVRIHFLTATELKGAEKPEFGLLLSRIRDRVSTLRALYGAGALALHYRAFGARAAAVRLTRCELTIVDDERVSKNTGQRHSLGGFVGLAEYEGYIGEFLPYLEVAQHIGVGRQTVWGKGDIAIETF
jgi:hypothetical protein